MKMIQALRLFPIMLISGCAMMPGQQADKWSADQTYNEARQAQAAANYDLSIQRLNELVENAPESPYAKLAPLELAFAHYKQKNYNAADTEVSRFIEEQPGHANLTYAHYLKGMIYFDQAQPNPENTQTFEINLARKSYQVFAELTKAYPDSHYHNDALKRMGLLRNKLAYSELDEAKQDMLAGNIDIAKDRAKYISTNYADTDAAKEAMAIIAEATPAIIKPVLADTIKTEEVAHKATADEAWLLQQNPAHYTIQIVGTSKKHWLKAFIEDNKLQDEVALYRRDLKGKDWYTALYGNFTNYEEANSVAKQMMSKLGIEGAWVRTFKHVQISIEPTTP